MKRALILQLDFFEAHFKVHYTKGHRLTYPIPLPTSVAGMLAGMLGMDGREAMKEFRDYLFGAALVNQNIAEAIETVTFLQFKGKGRKFVGRTHIIVNPSYYIVVQCPNPEELQSKIVEGIEYLPFGGQNDYFAKDWRVLDIVAVRTSTKVSNYLHSESVGELTSGASLQVLPVMHKLGEKEDFYFVLQGDVISKHNMQVCSVDKKNISLYKLDDFYTTGEWNA
jgi:CRISPR-associated Cas5-like protein